MQLYFIRLIGIEDNDFYRYEFFFADNANASLVENYDYKPCCLNKNVKPIVDETTVIYTIKTRIKLSFIQDSCCMSYKNAIDQVVAIAWESLDGYDEYPQDGRLVFHFGEEKEDIERKLALKNILMVNHSTPNV